MSAEVWKREFNFSYFLFQTKYPSSFYNSQWQSSRKVNLIYLMYKLIFAIIFVTVSIIYFLQFRVRAKWIIYLTTWGYLMCTVQALFSLFIIVRESILQRSENYDKQNYDVHLYGCYWFCFTAALDSAFVISIIYWSLFADYGTAITVIDIFLHAINSVMMLIELLVVAHPVRLLHFIWSVLFGLLYVFFSVIYFVVGGTDIFNNAYIYNILNWNKPGATILLTFLTLLFLLFVHFVTFLIYLLRMHIHKICYNYLTPDST